MTTYNGRSASYIPGKEVPNKEPPVSRYVVEKLYRVHRERIQRAEPTIDSHVKIPEFLTNQTWKKNAERQRLVVIDRENQDMYDRISKVENSESDITKQSKQHVKRVESKLNYLKKLKRHGRLVQLVKIQRENEHLLKRLEKAKPQYTLKKCKEWYKYHEHYKLGRRSDPTAGHIMHGMRGLLPSSLPPLSSSNSETADSFLNSNGKNRPLPSIASNSLTQASLASNSMLSTSPDKRRNSSDSPRKTKPNTQESEAEYLDTTFEQDEEYFYEDEEGEIHHHENGSVHSIAVSSHLTQEEQDGYQSEGERSDVSDPAVHDANSADLNLLSARPFALPFESKSCLVQVFSSKEYDENLRIRVLSMGVTQEVLAERLVPIDKAYEIINAGGHSSQIIHSTDNEDLQTLSTLLINMFKEADEDGSGSLTFDEFQSLMEQVELGISSQELRFVISEADENENGVVDYEEFVPLAVDLIQSFRARNKAKALNSQEDLMVDDLIYQTIAGSDLQRTADQCLEKIYEFDTKRYGLIRAPELKRCLNNVATSMGLRDNEISMLCQMLPRDQFGRVKYNSTPTAFFDTLSKVRFMTMKNAMIESQGSGLQKYLLDLCKDEEIKTEGYKGAKEKFVPTGSITCRSLINILSNSSRLSLSRLQVLVIMSEASVSDGMINYFQFVPVVAKAIELMFEPKALRQRAELIEKTDLSPEALLQGMTSDMFEQRLLTLFKSYDIDHNGLLDQNEFIACLESLELQLTYGEMVALMAAADVEQNGFLKFEEFVGFFTHNLLNLEREKRLRLLQSSMHVKDSGGKANHHNNKTDPSEGDPDLITRLLALFELYDSQKTGFIRFDDFDTILQNFSLHSSKFIMDIMLSELQVNDDGLVEYAKSLKLCGDLLKVFKAKESALEEHKQKEAEAEAKAVKISQVSIEDTNRIVKYLKMRMKEVNEQQIDAFTKYTEIQNVIRSPHSGLSRNEANMIISKLFMGITASRGNNNSSEGAMSTPSSTDKISLRQSAKSMKFQFSSQELFDAVFDARKTTIMRALLQEGVDSSSTKQFVLAQLQLELDEKKRTGDVAADSQFLPMQSCFDVLDRARQLQLTRAQIMFIISYADCYDRDSSALEVYRFAEHAASIIANLNMAEVMETRAEVINQGSIDDRKVLHGMNEKELYAILASGFERISESNNANSAIPAKCITRDQLRSLLREIVRLKLTERETSTILAGLPGIHLEVNTQAVPSAAFSSNGSVQTNNNICYEFDSVIQQLIESIRALNRETMIHRRVSLAAVSIGMLSKASSCETRKLQEESMSALRDLAQKLLNFVKLQSQGEMMMINLPMDGSHRRGSQLMQEDPSKMNNHEITTLFRAALFLPKLTHRMVVMQMPAMAVVSSKTSPSPVTTNRKVPNSANTRASAPMQMETTKSNVAIFLNLIAMEDTHMYTGCSLFVNIISTDGSITMCEQLPVRLTSLGLVDKEAAQQYAMNLVEKMYFEQGVNETTVTLKMFE